MNVAVWLKGVLPMALFAAPGNERILLPAKYKDKTTNVKRRMGFLIRVDSR
jgi:hypothetical protein